MKRWRLWAGAATIVAVMSGTAQAQAPEKKDVKLGVGGSNSLYYLPLAITVRLGFFKEQGLNVEVSDFKGGTQSLTALVGGSVDVVTGAYEHTIRMQVKGQDVVANVAWTIDRSGGRESWNFHTGYNLRCSDGTWRIVCFTAYAEGGCDSTRIEAG